jgi:hypothetical protein
LYSAVKQPLTNAHSRHQRNSPTVRLVGLSAVLALAGCGVQYRPVVSAINPVGPAGQPNKYAIAVSSPSAGTLGLVTTVDFSGDTVISTPQILSNPNYFILNPSGQQGFVINSAGSLNSIPLNNPAALITSQIVQTTLPPNSLPVTLTSLTPASTIPILFIPQQATSSVAALNSTNVSLFDDISVGNGGSNPVYVVGANGTPRVYVISQNAEGNLGQVDALEATSTQQLADSSTIPVGVKPVYGVMTADVRRAFILNQGSGTVNVINVPSNALDVTTPLITIPRITLAAGGTVAPAPVWADLAPTVSDLVVLNKAADGVSPGTLSVIQIPLCNAIAQPTNPNCNAANPIDAVGFGQVTATGTVGINPSMVSMLQDGTRAYVINAKDGTGICANTPGSDANAGSVSVVTLASGQVTTICGTAAGTAATSVGANANLISGHPNSISATTGTPTGKVYVTSPDSNYMTIIYTDTDSVKAHVNLQGLGLRVLVTAQ